jgi:NAD(P)-dependent dehydrogenase (short-subunit alcohol dehydrogenase family)
VIDVNLHGVFYCLKEGLEIMKRQGCGSIINIASIFGLTVADPAIISVPPYVASKFAVVGLTKEAAAEYGQYGVQVNAIAPGFHVGTRLGQDASSPARPVAERPSPQSALAARTPLRRTGEPRELKALLLYLASDSSAFVTGQVIAQDGGWTIW